MFGIKPKIVIKTKTEYVSVEKAGRFSGLNVLITGASGSIGSAIAHRFAAEGAMTLLTGRSRDKLDHLCEEIQNNGGKADAFIMDVTDAGSIESAMREMADKYQRIDVLINNAGFSARSEKTPLHRQSVENIDGLLATNLRGPLLTSREVVRYMQDSTQGRIINISSVVGLQGKDKHAEYAAAKAGLFGLMKSQAIELGKYGITVNCVSPGLVPREDASDEKLARFTETNLLGTICAPEDIAAACAFLASAEARFITGQNLSVDGGRSLGLRGD